MFKRSRFPRSATRHAFPALAVFGCLVAIVAAVRGLEAASMRQAEANLQAALDIAAAEALINTPAGSAAELAAATALRLAEAGGGQVNSSVRRLSHGSIGAAATRTMPSLLDGVGRPHQTIAATAVVQLQNPDREPVRVAGARPLRDLIRAEGATASVSVQPAVD